MGSQKKKTSKARPERAPMWVRMTWGGLTLSLAVLAVFLIFQAATHSAYVPEVEGNPSLQVDEAEIDLGDVKLGRYVNASFDVRNVGDMPLRFSREPWVTAVAGC